MTMRERHNLSWFWISSADFGVWLRSAYLGGELDSPRALLFL